MRKLIALAIGLGLSLSTVLPAESYILARRRVCTRDWNGVLNLRSGPGQNYRSLGTVKNGDWIDIVGGAQGTDGHFWAYIEPSWSTNRYWVRSDYIC